MPTAFTASQPAAHRAASGYMGRSTDRPSPIHYVRIQNTSLTFDDYFSSFLGIASGTGTKTVPMQPKAIHELFDDYGRMNSTLAAELPITNFLNQTTIPLKYIDPPTEGGRDPSDSRPQDKLYNGAAQIWKITHNGVDTHPVHFHLFNVQVINRVGWDGAIRPPDPNELGWKETVRMNPLEDCIVAMRFDLPPLQGSGKPGALPFAVPLSTRLLDSDAACRARPWTRSLSPTSTRNR